MSIQSFHIELDYLLKATKDIVTGGAPKEGKGFRVGGFRIGRRGAGDVRHGASKGQFHLLRVGVVVPRSEQSQALERRINQLASEQRRLIKQSRNLSARERKELKNLKEKQLQFRHKDIAAAVKTPSNISVPDGFTAQDPGAKLGQHVNGHKANNVQFVSKEVFAEKYGFAESPIDPNAPKLVSNHDPNGKYTGEASRSRGRPSGGEVIDPDDLDFEAKPTTRPEVTGKGVPGIDETGAPDISDTSSNPVNRRAAYDKLTPAQKTQVNGGEYPTYHDSEGKPYGNLEIGKEDDYIKDRVAEGRNRNALTREQSALGKSDRGATKDSSTKRLQRITAILGDKDEGNWFENRKVKIPAVEKTLEALKDNFDDIWNRLPGAENLKERNKALNSLFTTARTNIISDLEVQIGIEQGKKNPKTVQQLKAMQKSVANAVSSDHRNFSRPYFDNNSGQTKRQFKVKVADTQTQEVKIFRVYADSAKNAEKIIKENVGSTKIISTTEAKIVKPVAVDPNKPVLSGDVPDVDKPLGPDPSGKPAVAGAVDDVADDAAKGAAKAAQYSKMSRFLGTAGRTGLGRVAGVAFGPAGTLASLGLMGYSMVAGNKAKQLEQYKAQSEAYRTISQKTSQINQQWVDRKNNSAAVAAARTQVLTKRPIELSNELQAILGVDQNKYINRPTTARASPEQDMYRSLLQ